MSPIGRRKKAEEMEGKVLDVSANMQGTLSFGDPVNLKINGEFQGELDAKGTLTISDTALVRAKIRGDIINVAGKVEGDILARKELRLIRPARIKGDITTPVLSVEPGALLEGKCHMLFKEKKSGLLNVEEVASYLDIEPATVVEWADSGKVPAIKEDGAWAFEKEKIESWVASQK